MTFMQKRIVVRWGDNQMENVVAFLGKVYELDEPTERAEDNLALVMFKGLGCALGQIKTTEGGDVFEVKEMLGTVEGYTIRQLFSMKLTDRWDIERSTR